MEFADSTRGAADHAVTDIARHDWEGFRYWLSCLGRHLAHRVLCHEDHDTVMAHAALIDTLDDMFCHAMKNA